MTGKELKDFLLLFSDEELKEKIVFISDLFVNSTSFAEVADEDYYFNEDIGETISESDWDEDELKEAVKNDTAYITVHKGDIIIHAL